ncbi:MAG: histidinol dehydrogenase, partial [Jiangellaceae bacterium]|nr:histidinol dehydrogenase [Jiangellaceae bacterium]
MLRRIDLRGRHVAGDPSDYRALVPRARVDVTAAVEAVRPICDAVRDRGLRAVRELSLRFDGVELADPRVPAAALESAADALDPAVRVALDESVARVRRVHADQCRPDVTTTVVPGGTVTERWLPVQRVGLYVPGGFAVYPSSVVMNVVPAQTAGVESIAVASPPQR